MTRSAFRLLLASGAAAAALAGAATPASAAIECADLTNLKIAASEIGLPSGGATIASAQIANRSRRSRDARARRASSARCWARLPPSIPMRRRSISK